MSANEVQYGGDHYKKHTIQPWDYILANNIGYMEGSAIKYLSRWKDKGGVQDLKKAIHFIERLIEEEEKKQPKQGVLVKAGQLNGIPRSCEPGSWFVVP